MTESSDRPSAPAGALSAAGTAPRLPDALRLGPVHLQVGDLERSLEYYTKVLGLELRERTPASGSLHARDESEPLVVLLERAGAAPVRANSRLGLYHFAILLPDRPALGRFVGHLARTGTRLGAADHLVSEAIYLRDPDGLGIEVYADRPRSAWRHAGAELLMTTEPLDTASVIDAARGEPWSGMPRGTTMGHLHLHVGELDDASRFYHDVLGLDRTVWSYPGALFLSAGGYHHHLGVNTWAGRAPRAGDDEARLLEWRMVLPSPDDARTVAGRLRAAGHAVRDQDGGWLVEDPWGTALRLSAA
jgi:catechol 2,3-dioxygenase